MLVVSGSRLSMPKGRGRERAQIVRSRDDRRRELVASACRPHRHQNDCCQDRCGGQGRRIHQRSGFVGRAGKQITHYRTIAARKRREDAL